MIIIVFRNMNTGFETNNQLLYTFKYCFLKTCGINSNLNTGITTMFNHYNPKLPSNSDKALYPPVNVVKICVV